MLSFIYRFLITKALKSKYIFQTCLTCQHAMTAKEKHILKDARSSIKNNMTCICFL